MRVKHLLYEEFETFQSQSQSQDLVRIQQQGDKGQDQPISRNSVQTIGQIRKDRDSRDYLLLRDMYSGQRGRGRPWESGQAQGQGQGRGAGKAGSRKIPLKRGLFADGVWYCNCEPRLPAPHFQTKNGGKNHGRWFYTCQKPQHQRCNFFLWQDEAKPREAAAVLNNSRSEPGAASGGVHAAASKASPRFDNQRHGKYDLTPSRPGKYTPRSPSRTASPSPFRRVGESSGAAHDEDRFDWPLTGEEELQLTQEVDSTIDKGIKYTDTARKVPPNQYPETPRKGNCIGTEPLTTPGKRRRSLFEDDEIGLPTPVTERKHVEPFLTPSLGQTRRTLFTSGSEPRTPSPHIKAETLSSPAATPTPTRFRDVGVAEDKQPDLINEVFGLLEEHGTRLNQNTRDVLGVLLGKHAVRMQGIAKGRDISRAAIKERDAKIAMLQHRIETLEADRETDKAMIYYLKQKRNQKD